jgi:AcrR family transcriptional regulator
LVGPTGIVRKRERTRQSLVDAARSLVEEGDQERLSIQDITDRADVGLGTFYNYFDNKQMVFEAVLDQIREQFEQRLSTLRSNLSDPASLIAATLQFCFTEALDNAEWQGFLSKSGLEGEYLLLQNQDQCLLDIKTGSQRGRFKIDNPAFVANLIHAMARHTTLEIAGGRLGREAIPDTTRYILRMLGLPELVAKAITQTPLPQVAAQQKRVLKEVLPYLQRKVVEQI